LKIATWNVNGIRARQAQFLEWIEGEQPDVVCLQEIKATPAQLAQALCELPGYQCYWHGAGAYSGVSLNLRTDAFPEPPAFTHPSFDRDTRMVVAKSGKLVVASTYVPNGGKDYRDKLVFLRELQEWVAERIAAGEDVVVCGDLNVTRTDRDVHPKERKFNAVGQRPDERALFEQLLSTGLIDLARELDPDNDGLFTWWAPWRNLRERNIGWRIDYVLASRSLGQRAISCVVQSKVGTSDHAPVVATFE
jgi:exodeoxyribonuclease-3